MIVYLILNEEYGIVSYKWFQAYLQESDYLISQAGVLKNKLNLVQFSSFHSLHCRPDQKSAPQKICGSACTLVNQLVWSKNDPWWRPDFFWATPKFEKASKRPQNWKLKTIRNFNPVDGFKHLRGHLGVLFQAQSNRKVKSAVYCTNQLT